MLVYAACSALHPKAKDFPGAKQQKAMAELGAKSSREVADEIVDKMGGNYEMRVRPKLIFDSLKFKSMRTDTLQVGKKSWHHKTRISPGGYSNLTVGGTNAPTAWKTMPATPLISLRNTTRFPDSSAVTSSTAAKSCRMSFHSKA